MQPILRTQRLILRPIRDDDVEAMHRMLSDPVVMRYWSSLPHETEAQSLQWIAANRDAVVAGKGMEYGAEYEGKLIGRGIFWNGNEIGYLFDKDYWGKGFARECLTAMIDHAFAERDWSEITADIDPRNQASGNILVRLGFQRTSFIKNTYHIGDEWSDSLYFALSREVWLGRQR